MGCKIRKKNPKADNNWKKGKFHAKNDCITKIFKAKALHLVFNKKFRKSSPTVVMTLFKET